MQHSLDGIFREIIKRNPNRKSMQIKWNPEGINKESYATEISWFYKVSSKKTKHVLGGTPKEELGKLA